MTLPAAQHQTEDNNSRPLYPGLYRPYFARVHEGPGASTADQRHKQTPTEQEADTGPLLGDAGLQEGCQRGPRNAEAVHSVCCCCFYSALKLSCCFCCYC